MSRDSFLFLFSHEPWLLPPSLEMIFALKKRGYNVDILYCNKEVGKGDLVDFPIDSVVEGPKGPKTLIDRCLFPFRLGRRFGHVLREKKYDAIIACDISALQILSQTEQQGFKKIYWAFELTGIEKRLRLSWDAYRSVFFSSFLRRMDVVIAPSHERMEILKRHCLKTSIIVIGNFRANRFHNVVRDNGQNDNSIKMAFAGRISFASGIGDIMTEVSRYSTLSLTLAGIMDAPFEKWFRSKDFKNVRYAGSIENSRLIDFLHQFDVSVCSYSQRVRGIEARHPAPTKAGDAIAAGCILFCSAHPYLISLVEGSSLGFCFEDAELQSMVAKVAVLTRNEIGRFRERLDVAFRERYCMDVKVDMLLNAL